MLSRGVALREVCDITDEQILEILQDITAQLDALHREVATIREVVLPDLAPIIAMHQGARAGAEKE
jgi:hypothetical protein